MFWSANILRFGLPFYFGFELIEQTSPLPPLPQRRPFPLSSFAFNCVILAFANSLSLSPNYRRVHMTSSVAAAVIPRYTLPRTKPPLASRSPSPRSSTGSSVATLAATAGEGRTSSSVGQQSRDASLSASTHHVTFSLTNLAPTAQKPKADHVVVPRDAPSHYFSRSPGGGAAPHAMAPPVTRGEGGTSSLEHHSDESDSRLSRPSPRTSPRPVVPRPCTIDATVEQRPQGVAKRLQIVDEALKASKAWASQPPRPPRAAGSSKLTAAYGELAKGRWLPPTTGLPTAASRTESTDPLPEVSPPPQPRDVAPPVPTVRSNRTLGQTSGVVPGDDVARPEGTREDTAAQTSRPAYVRAMVNGHEAAALQSRARIVTLQQYSLTLRKDVTTLEGLVADLRGELAAAEQSRDHLQGNYEEMRALWEEEKERADLEFDLRETAERAASNAAAELRDVNESAHELRQLFDEERVRCVDLQRQLNDVRRDRDRDGQVLRERAADCSRLVQRTRELERTIDELKQKDTDRECIVEELVMALRQKEKEENEVAGEEAASCAVESNGHLHDDLSSLLRKAASLEDESDASALHSSASSGTGRLEADRGDSVTRPPRGPVDVETNNSTTERRPLASDVWTAIDEALSRLRVSEELAFSSSPPRDQSDPKRPRGVAIEAASEEEVSLAVSCLTEDDVTCAGAVRRQPKIDDHPVARFSRLRSGESTSGHTNRRHGEPLEQLVLISAAASDVDGDEQQHASPMRRTLPASRERSEGYTPAGAPLDEDDDDETVEAFGQRQRSVSSKSDRDDDIAAIVITRDGASSSSRKSPSVATDGSQVEPCDDEDRFATTTTTTIPSLPLAANTTQAEDLSSHIRSAMDRADRAATRRMFDDLVARKAYTNSKLDYLRSIILPSTQGFTREPSAIAARTANDKARRIPHDNRPQSEGPVWHAQLSSSEALRRTPLLVAV